jgi:hypothetical protein
MNCFLAKKKPCHVTVCAQEKFQREFRIRLACLLCWREERGSASPDDSDFDMPTDTGFNR